MTFPNLCCLNSTLPPHRFLHVPILRLRLYPHGYPSGAPSYRTTISNSFLVSEITILLAPTNADSCCDDQLP